ncbi:MAG: amidohydrolase [Planctomyces sp.]|nr:amidohydrolase [Planctomyces sp.]
MEHTGPTVMDSADAPGGPAGLARAIDRALPELVALRHHLHMHPEVAYCEHGTCAVIAQGLERLGVAHTTGWAGGTGVVAVIPATGDHAGNGRGDIDGRRAVALRADIDALPITERTGLPYASVHAGRMHACGHDGHTAILMGAARVLAAWPSRPRPVVLVFQPAEEGGGGADRMCREGLLDGARTGVAVGCAYGLHGWPDLPLGHLGTRPGPLLAATDEFEVTLHGVQCHAAYPQRGADPVLAAAQCISAAQSIASRTVGPLDSVVVSVTQVRAGTASNVIPDRAHFSGTLRTLKTQTRATVKRRFDELVRGVAGAMGCRAEIAWHDGYPVTHNDPALTERFFAAAARLVGPERVHRIEHPTMGGEDFSYYAQRVPAVFYCLGLRQQAQSPGPSLHQAEFDFADAAIPLGVEMMVRLALEPAEPGP